MFNEHKHGEDVSMDVWHTRKVNDHMYTNLEVALIGDK